jgi:ATP-binding protein involved in chromosome partitioning
MPGPKKDDVFQALGQLKIPGTETDMVTAGLISHVAACDGLIAVTVAPGVPDDETRALVEESVRSVVAAMDGVKQVKIKFEGDGPSSQDKKDAITPGVDGVKHIISIGSGKGGVGKSTLSVNLAVSMARNGARVGLLDTDVYGPSIPMMLGKKEHPTVVGQTMLPLEAHGVTFMSMGLIVPDDQPVVWRGPMLHKSVQQFVQQVAWGELDYLLIDLPPGTGDVHLSLMQTAKVSGSVVVSTPQPVALLDAGKALRMFQETGGTVLGMIENMSHYVCPDCGRKDYLFGEGGVRKACKQFGVDFLAEVPLIATIREGGDEGMPIVASAPDSPAGLAFAAAATALVAALEATGKEGRGSLKVTD